MALFRKFAEYDRGKPFLAWAYGFAFLEVLKQRERVQRGTRLLARHLLEQLASEREQSQQILQARLQALEVCLQQLPADDQDLIRKRYQDKLPADELARQFGPSRRTLFRKLDRIRRSLYDCISRRLAGAGLA